MKSEWKDFPQLISCLMPCVKLQGFTSPRDSQVQESITSTSNSLETLSKILALYKENVFVNYSWLQINQMKLHHMQYISYQSKENISIIYEAKYKFKTKPKSSFENLVHLWKRNKYEGEVFGNSYISYIKLRLYRVHTISLTGRGI